MSVATTDRRDSHDVTETVLSNVLCLYFYFAILL
jgi:hypothetical protein